MEGWKRARSELEAEPCNWAQARDQFVLPLNTVRNELMAGQGRAGKTRAGQGRQD